MGVGQPVYLLGWGSECSDVEEPPFFGADAAAQRACAIAADADVTSVTLSIDGGPVIELIARFESISPQRHVVLPEDNFLGVAAQRASFVAHGWGATLIPSRRGRHDIVVDVVGGPAPGPATVVLNVVRG